MLEVAELNERLGIARELLFRLGRHGALVAEISNSQGSGSIAMQGAQVLDWRPGGQEPVVWLSDDAKFQEGKSLRGGAPVCWPWFGPHPDDPSKPSHGFARNLEWEPVETAEVPGGTRILLRLIPGEAQRSMWPYMAELTLSVTMGKRLRLELTTRNTGTEGFELTQAIHTYFRVGNIGDAQVVGLKGCDYVDKVGIDAVRRQEGPIEISREVDRIYFGCPGDSVIVDRALKRHIRISKSGSSSYVVWNPWIDKSAALGDMGAHGYRQMICVETTNAGADRVSVPPGNSFSLVTEYAVEAR